MERLAGIEPASQAWEAWVIPLYDSRRNNKKSGIKNQSPAALNNPALAAEPCLKRTDFTKKRKSFFNLLYVKTTQTV